VQGTDNRVFREGDEVALSGGTYWGTPGVFIRLKADTNWADIAERNGKIRSHPVAWLSHAKGPPNGQTAGKTT
jgi:hypothetical protein